MVEERQMSQLQGHTENQEGVGGGQYIVQG